MSGQETRSIALFFFLSLLDEKKTIELSRQLIRRLEKLWSVDVSVDREVSLISESHKIWKKNFKSHGQVFGSSLAGEESWVFPKNVSLEAWKKFLQAEEGQNIFPLIWSEILGYSHEQISQALKITVGTVRTRVARALVHLGAHCTGERVHA